MSQSDLEKFVKQNQKKPASEEANSRQPTSSHAPKNPTAFYPIFQLLNGEKLAIFFAITLVVFGIGVYRLLAGRGVSSSEAVVWIAVGAFVLSDLFFFYFFFHYAKYKSVLSKKKFVLEGWNELVHNRSVNFWAGQSYLRFSMKCELSPRATSTHHQAVQIFFDQCVGHWGSKHSGSWKGPKPAELEVKGNALMADVAIHSGTTFLIRLLAFYLPPFVALLGDGLAKISFAAQGEKQFNFEAEEDPYQAERDRKWMDKEF